MGLNKRAVRREIDNKLNEAAPRSFFTGDFRNYLDYQLSKHGSESRVTETGIFCIRDDCVLTYLKVPPEFRKQHLVQMARWRDEQRETQNDFS